MTTTTTTTASGDDAALKGMLGDLAEAAKEEGRAEALGRARNVLAIMKYQAEETAVRFQQNGDLRRYADGQGKAIECMLAWIQAELGELDLFNKED